MKANVLFVVAALMAAPAFAQGKSGEAKGAEKKEAAQAQKPADAQKPPEAGPKMEAKKDASAGEMAMAELKDANGKSVGQIHLQQAAKGVIVHIMVNDLPPGEHAIHIHETGQCEAPFKTAGGHFNPKHKQHGIANKKGMHVGDLPNLKIGADGKLEVTVFTDQVTLTKGALSVFDKDGSAFVIHAGADDYKSDPAGNAGDRIACGVIQK